MRLFISYAHSDLTLVTAVVQVLQEAQHSPWFDNRLMPGQDWQAELLRAIERCDALVYMLSADSTASGWCQWEYLQAVKLNKPIMPVLLRRPIEWPEALESLKRIQYLDISDGLTPEATARLVSGLFNLQFVPAQQTPEPPARPAGKPSRSQLIADADLAFAQALAAPAAVAEQDAPPAAQEAPAPAQAAPAPPRTGVDPKVAAAFAAAVLRNPAQFEPETVLIPAGQFRMGSTPDEIAQIPSAWAIAHAREAEQPRQAIRVNAFHIGKYPVTVGQFRAFVSSGGYSDQRFWTNSGWRRLRRDEWFEPRYWEHIKWTGMDRLPVVGVNWYEAVAYTRWLSDISGKNYRLPTEIEWEKAARGGDGRIFPWGNEWDFTRCNSVEGRKGGTTPVGAFSPQGDSPYGVADMAGNVREWCVTKWRDNYNSPPDHNPEGADDRVLRGGSWHHPLFVSRTAWRARFITFNWFNFIGFRVACDV